MRSLLFTRARLGGTDVKPGRNDEYYRSEMKRARRFLNGDYRRGRFNMVLTEDLEREFLVGGDVDHLEYILKEGFFSRAL